MHRGFFLPFYFFTFLPLKAAATCYTEGGSDGCKEGDGSPDKLGGKILNFPKKVIPLCHE